MVATASPPKAADGAALPSVTGPDLAEKTRSVRDVEKALAVPFRSAHVRWKPQRVSGKKCFAICYVDARVVMGRLDQELGVTGWKDDYEVLPDGSVVCRLSCRINGEWVTKTDVGSPSEQPDEHDRMKAAFSDALKRSALKFGVGRYLWFAKGVWVDYDPAKKQIVRVPALADCWTHPDDLAERRANSQPQPGKSGPASTPTGPPATAKSRDGADPKAESGSRVNAYGQPAAEEAPSDVSEEALTGGTTPQDRPPDQEQFDVIQQLMAATAVTGRKVLAQTQKKYGVESFDDFTHAIAQNVIEWLSAVKAKNESTAQSKRESNSAGERSGTAGQ